MTPAVAALDVAEAQDYAYPVVAPHPLSLQLPGYSNAAVTDLRMASYLGGEGGSRVRFVGRDDRGNHAIVR